MSRQLLIDTIERLYLEQKEPKKNLIDELYMFTKYPALAQIFNSYRSKDEKWPQIVREVIFYDRQDIRFMYNRVMQLIRRFNSPIGSYFTVNASTGTYLLPDRLSDLNRLFGLYEEFFYDICPPISRRLNFEVHNQERSSNVLQGKIDWNETILNSVQRGTSLTPILFTAFLNEQGFETPENLLLVLCVLRMQRDASILHGYPFAEPLTTEERAILERIKGGCDNLLNNLVLRELIPSASRFVRPDTSDSQAVILESQVSERLNEDTKKMLPYSRLLDWSRRYRQLNLRSLAPNSTNFPIDRRENLDTMFEVWILFEFLDFLVRDRSAVVSVESYPNKFRIKLDDFDFTLRYERSYVGWALGAVPDFTIEVDEKPVVIMDAKNWQDSKDDAVYKMLGYLDNLDAQLGILFFPNDISVPAERVIKPIGLRHHLRQCFASSVVPPANTAEARTLRTSAFAQVASLIVEYLS